MKKLMMVAIGMVACSIVTGCWTGSVSKGGAYANLPDPKPDEYLLHWENTKTERVEYVATTREVLYWFEVGERAPWMLRDKEQPILLGLGRKYSNEDKARNAALYKACLSEDCDALLGTMYEVETISYGPFYSESKCTVRGYPAKITGIENITNKAK